MISVRTNETIFSTIFIINLVAINIFSNKCGAFSYIIHKKNLRNGFSFLSIQKLHFFEITFNITIIIMIN